MQAVWTNRSKRQAERAIAEMGMGVLLAVRESRMTLEQAQEELFNLDVYQAARSARLSPALIEFLEWGMELEDVPPAARLESFDRMGELLKGVIDKTLRA
jgi:hypothetical protein